MATKRAGKSRKTKALKKAKKLKATKPLAIYMKYGSIND